MHQRNLFSLSNPVQALCLGFIDPSSRRWWLPGQWLEKCIYDWTCNQIYECLGNFADTSTQIFKLSRQRFGILCDWWYCYAFGFDWQRSSGNNPSNLKVKLQLEEKQDQEGDRKRVKLPLEQCQNEIAKQWEIFRKRNLPFAWKSWDQQSWQRWCQSSKKT